MTNRGRTRNPRTKSHRFDTLRRRRRNQPFLFEAIERRDRAQSARLAAARSCLRASFAPTALKQRRDEYLEIPKPAPSPPVPRAVVGAVALAFLLPLFLALSSSFTVSPERIHRTIAARVRLQHPNAAGRARSQRVASANLPVVAKPSQPTSMPQAHASNVVAQASSHVRKRAPSLAKASPAIVAVQHPANQFIASILRLVFGSAPPEQSAAPRATSRPMRPARLASRQVKHVTIKPEVTQPKPVSPWTLSPDGTWVAVVRAPAPMQSASFSASTGQLIQLERSAVSPDSATVTIGWSRPVAVSISSGDQTLTKTLAAPDAGIEAFDAVAQAVGPHLVDVGWTPLDPSTNVSEYEVFRASGEGERPELVATLPADQHSLRDPTVDPASRYRYSIVAETTDDSVQASTALVETPLALPQESANAVSGKGMFLYFSSLSGDPRNFHHYDPDDVIAEAQRAGIHVIELRMARGACTMAQTQEAHAWLDRLMDAAAAADIRLLAWTVPRRATTQDLAETVGAAAYTTPAGNGFAGLALDLEEGDHYMGGGSQARFAMVEYIHDVRAAVGRNYLIVATVASPNMGGGPYPYAQIARYADVLQPMEYWHYFDEADHHEYVRGEVAQAATEAVARTRQLAGRDIPVNVAGQSVDLEGTGAPSGQEILWSLHASKSVGAIGETFFDWAGTKPDAWAAIQAFDW